MPLVVPNVSGDKANVPLVDANIAARQRKKIEKDRRRKQYDDLQVQGTNNSSIVSKRSVEKLYQPILNPKLSSWFEIFVPKGKRRSPAINRGYWIRMESIKQLILKISNKSENQNKRINIVNLGCGFDPLPFQLLEEFPHLNFNFLDIDYPDLVANKLGMIERSSEILNIIGDKTNPIHNSIKFNTDIYKLIGCDLKNSVQYKEILNSLISESDINIFIAEVSLAYMKPEHANEIIEISSNFHNSHFLILEQILPIDKYHSFSRKMLYHFSHLRSPLQCVEHYPKPVDQINRFLNWFPHVEIENLLGNWELLVDFETKCKISEIESFDEWEEYIIFCQHYVIVHATNCDNNPYLYVGKGDRKNNNLNINELQDNQLFIEDTITLSLDENFMNDQVDYKKLELKFPAVSDYEDGKFLIHGGLSQTRTDDLLVCDTKDGSISQASKSKPLASERESVGPCARMCHTFTSMGNNQYLIIGGRGRPDQVFNDVYKLNYTSNFTEWTLLAALSGDYNQRSRHSAVKLAESQVLIFGGLQKSVESIGNKLFTIYDIATETTIPLLVDYDNDNEATASTMIPNLSSCTMTYNESTGIGYICGGVIEHDSPEVNNKLYKFSVDIEQAKVTVDVIMEHQFFARIGCHGKLLDDKLIIIGGVSLTEIHDRFTSIITFNFQTQQFKLVEISQSIWQSHPPVFIGFGTADKSEGQLTVVSGGAVCYSFGSSYNGVYTLQY